MSAYVQKGKAVYVSTVPKPTGVNITGISAAAKAVITVTNTAAVGDIIKILDSGMASLDGRAFEIETANGTSVTINFDTTGEVAATTGSAEFYSLDDATMVETCFNSFAYTREASATITAGTFCGTTTLAGQAGASTIEFAGYDDPESAGLHELLKAQDDAIPRVVVYNYPPSASSTGKGYKFIMPEVTVAGMVGAPAATSDGAATFSGSCTANGKPTYSQWSDL